jgi:serpin B
MKKALHFALADEKLHPAMGALISDLNAAGKAGGFQLNVANALWGQKGHQFLPEFLALNKASYGAGLETVDFAGDAEAARRTINAWVEKQTQDKIKDLMPPGTVSDLTRLVLTNAVYFKGRWAAPFDKKATEESPFQVSLQKKVQVPMMYLTTYLPFKQDNWSVEDEYSTETNNQTKFGFRALWLPYVDEKLLADPLYKENGIIAAPQQQPLSMIVFLPRRVDGLAELEQMLTSDKLQKWLEEFKIEEVRVYLPKFKITAEFRLDGALQDLGVRSAFDAQAADFSGIDGAKGFCLGAAMHKAYVEVNEEGTEAAAASAVSDMIGVPPTFKADHPFVFLIRDNRSGSILFLGRVANPAPGSPEGTPKK